MYVSDQPTIAASRIIRWAIVLALVLLAGFGLWYVLSHGALRVSSNSKTAEISVTLVTETDKVAATGKNGSLFSVLPNGDYIVTAQDGQRQQKTFVTVSAFGTKEISLNPPELLGSEPVTNFSVSSFAASIDKLSMFDSDSAKFISVGQDNIYNFSDDTYQFESGVWTSAMNGYAVTKATVDQQKRFIQISDGAIREVPLPGKFTDQTYMAFNTSPTGELYVMQDGVLSKREADGAYEKIVETNKQALVQSVNSKYVSLMYRNAEEECEYQFVSLQSKTIKKMSVTCVQSPDYSYSARWSADEKYLALTTGDYLAVYDQSFVEQYIIPDVQAAHPVWLSASELSYVSENNVWKYDVQTKTTSIIATTPEYISIEGMRKADDSNTLYFIGRIDDQLTLYRTTAKADPLSSAEKVAQSNMHELDYFCRIRYINFVSLKIIASTSPEDQGDCTTLIEEYLSSITVPSLPIQYILDEEFGYFD